MHDILPVITILVGVFCCFLSFRKIVLNGGTQAPYPFGIATFENHVFFTDWTKMGVMKANRFKENNPELIYRTAKRPGHVVVSHSVLQPVGEGTRFQSLISPFNVIAQRTFCTSNTNTRSSSLICFL